MEADPLKIKYSDFKIHYKDENNKLIFYSELPQEIKSVIDVYIKNFEKKIGYMHCGLCSISQCLKYIYRNDVSIYPKISQKEILENVVEKIVWKTKKDIEQGLTLQNCYDILETLSKNNGLNIKLTKIQNESSELVHADLKNDLNRIYLQDSKESVLVNYYYANICGHICTIGGFIPADKNPKKIDLVLILDNEMEEEIQPHWMDLKILCKLLCTIDKDANNNFRGYICIEKLD